MRIENKYCCEKLRLACISGYIRIGSLMDDRILEIIEKRGNLILETCPFCQAHIHPSCFYL